MTDAIKHDNTPPHYQADAGGDRCDPPPLADVRGQQPTLAPATLPVRHFQRPDGQGDLNPADDATPPDTGTCSPYASLSDILDTLTFTATPNQTALPSATADDSPVEAIQQQLHTFEEHLPGGVADDFQTDADQLKADLARSNDDPEWSRR